MDKIFTSAASQDSRPKVLYHGSSRQIDGNIIHPTFCATHTKARRGNFIFAADDQLLALAHAVKDRNCVTAGYMGGEIYLLVSNLPSYLGENEDKLENLSQSRVFEIPAESFERVNDHRYPYNEWVCSASIKTENLTSYRIPSLRFAMEQGLQILYLRKNELEPNEFFICKGMVEPSSVASLIECGCVGSLNIDKDIAPSQQLTAYLQQQDPSQQSEQHDIFSGLTPERT